MYFALWASVHTMHVNALFLLLFCALFSRIRTKRKCLKWILMIFTFSFCVFFFHWIRLLAVQVHTVNSFSLVLAGTSLVVELAFCIVMIIEFISKTISCGWKSYFKNIWCLIDLFNTIVSIWIISAWLYFLACKVFFLSLYLSLSLDIYYICVVCNACFHHLSHPRVPWLSMRGIFLFI